MISIKKVHINVKVAVIRDWDTGKNDGDSRSGLNERTIRGAADEESAVKICREIEGNQTKVAMIADPLPWHMRFPVSPAAILLSRDQRSINPIKDVVPGNLVVKGAV